jgi:hypothetical protein
MTMENEILREALVLVRRQNSDLAIELCGVGRFSMKRVTDTLGRARSNIAERVKGVRPNRGRKPVMAILK